MNDTVQNNEVKTEDNTNIKKYKSPGFYVGIIGAALIAVGVAPSELTSWMSVFDLIVDTLKNPYVLVGVIMAVYGVWNNPTKKGVN